MEATHVWPRVTASAARLGNVLLTYSLMLRRPGHVTGSRLHDADDSLFDHTAVDRHRSVACCQLAKIYRVGQKSKLLCYDRYFKG